MRTTKKRSRRTERPSPMTPMRKRMNAFRSAFGSTGSMSTANEVRWLHEHTADPFVFETSWQPLVSHCPFDVPFEGLQQTRRRWCEFGH